jgi:hypothetical protein
MPSTTEIVAALADAGRLHTFARIVLAEPPDATREVNRQVRRLIEVGLVGRTDEGTLVAHEDAFGAALAQLAQARADDVPVGIDPALGKLFAGGRLTTMPGGQLRRALLESIADSVFEPDVVYSESAVNEKLVALYDDWSALRRYLVDEGLLSRSPDGTEYRR